MKTQVIHTAQTKKGQVSFEAIGECTRKVSETAALIHYGLITSKNSSVAGMVAFKSVKDAIATYAHNIGREGVVLGSLIIK
jgi:hypothetical protein